MDAPAKNHIDNTSSIQHLRPVLGMGFIAPSARLLGNPVGRWIPGREPKPLTYTA